MPQGLDIGYKKVQFIKLQIGLMLFWVSWILPMTIVSGILSITYSELTIMFYLSAGILFGVIVAVIVLVGLWIRRYYESFQFELLEEEILIREGVITKNERHIPYGRIQNLNIVRGFFQRRYGIATLNIETAGSSAVAKSPNRTAEGIIPGIRDPESLIQQILPKLGYKREGVSMGLSTEKKGEELEVLKDINADLKEIRKLIEKRS